MRGGAAVDVSDWAGSEALLAQPPVLERDNELAAVRAVIENLCAHARADSGADQVHRGELLLVESRAGWGKTTILDEARRIAVENHCTVLLAKGGEREQTRSFLVVKELFYKLLAGYTDAERTALLGSWFDIIAPALGLCPAAAGSTPDRLAISDALDWLMTSLTRNRGPIVMILDDAHWADAESLSWITSFAQRLHNWPVLLLVARRTEEVTEVSPLLRTLATLDRAQRLRLGPLSRTGSAQMVHMALGPAVDEGFRERCYEVSGGGPFVLWATLREFKRLRLAPVDAHAGRLASIAAAQIGEKLSLRLESMGAATLAVARAVAILGSDATVVRVADLAEVDVHQVGEVADRLRAAAILVNQDVLGFVHPLIAAAVYDNIPSHARSSLHANAARLLVRDGRDARSAVFHLLATRPRNDQWIVDQLRAAADQEKRAGAPESALRCLQRAMEEPPRPADRAAVHYELGRALFSTSPQGAIEELRKALEADSEVRQLREQIVLQLSRALGYTDQIKEAVELLDTEAQAANASASRLRLQAEHFLWAVFWVDDPDYPARARRLKNLVLRLEGNNRTERCLLALRAWYGVMRGDPMVQVLASADQAWGPGLNWTDEDWGFEIPSLLALVYMYCDKNDRAEQLFSAGVKELESHGWSGTQLSYAHAMRSLVRYRQGKLAAAEHDARRALALSDRLPEGLPLPWYSLGPLIEVLIARGDIPQALALAERYQFGKPFPNAVVFPVPQAVRGELRLATGENRSAAEDFTEAGEKLEARGVANPAFCAWKVNLARALAGDDPETAYEHASEALRRAYRFGAPSAMGQALRVTGRLEGGQKGLAKIEDALMWLEHSDARYEYALTLVEYGIWLRREFGDRDAVDTLFEGLNVALECGADALAEAARAELVDIGELPPSRALGGGPGAIR
ncbi:ATP-binding protein [Yinghuangia soli]|uniref:AAA family ATPase n=1 Tax=Yinghuangia soli TaxID=2908204 RepID=A0AA41PYQ4_9ACTN|nr:AAA family ATPase [Yinghuangia soli]MCF2527810.1 AAA family ATPase [Yinghuangia soli]